MRAVKIRLEGFWYSKNEPWLPKPVANKKPWDNKKEFLKKLGKIQNKIGLCSRQKGFSYCRLCEKNRNGTAEYKHKGWRWPEGYEHYIDVHNVIPSTDFYNMVMGIKSKNDVADVGAISDAIEKAGKERRKNNDELQEAIKKFREGQEKRRETTPQQFALLLVNILPKFCSTFNAMHAMPPEFWQAMLGKMYREDVLNEKE